jgi:hypothetical protein
MYNIRKHLRRCRVPHLCLMCDCVGEPSSYFYFSVYFVQWQGWTNMMMAGKDFDTCDNSPRRVLHWTQRHKTNTFPSPLTDYPCKIHRYSTCQELPILAVHENSHRVHWAGSRSGNTPNMFRRVSSRKLLITIKWDRHIRFSRMSSGIWCRCYVTTVGEPLVGIGSVNTFPQQQTRTQQWYSNRNGVFCVVRAEGL